MALKSYTVDWGELHRLPDRVDGALYARTNRYTRLFQVWPAGHLLSSHEERRQRRAKGEPLGTPDALIFRAIVGLHNGGGRPQSLPV